jgi:hypothetical protein
VTIAWLGFFLEFSLKIQKGVLYLDSLVTNIATVTIGGTLAVMQKMTGKFNNLMQQMIKIIFVELWKNHVND